MHGRTPDTLPARIWRAVNLYRVCNARELTASPSAVMDEDAWTMDAFAVLRGTDAEIDAAMLREKRTTEGGP